jgi:hypothetical protein
VLLISVFKNEAEADVDFKIEVTQATKTMSIGETHFGYVEKNVARNYNLEVKDETVIVINSFHQECFTLEVQQFDTKNGIWQNYQPIATQSHLIINKTAVPVKYLIQVVGTASCSYQISFSSAAYQLYELH